MRPMGGSTSSSGARRPPALFPRTRHGHVRCPPPPARVIVHIASLALFVVFWLLVAVGHEGKRGDARGDDAGGERQRARGGGARRTKFELGEDGTGGRDAGHSITHECSTPSAISPD